MKPPRGARCAGRRRDVLRESAERSCSMITRPPGGRKRFKYVTTSSPVCAARPVLPPVGGDALARWQSPERPPWLLDRLELGVHWGSARLDRLMSVEGRDPGEGLVTTSAVTGPRARPAAAARS